VTHHSLCFHQNAFTDDGDECSICMVIRQAEQATAEIIAVRIGDYEQSLTTARARDIAMNCRMLAVAL
jgi:hypothetical protein